MMNGINYHFVSGVQGKLEMLKVKRCINHECVGNYPNLCETECICTVSYDDFKMEKCHKLKDGSYIEYEDHREFVPMKSIDYE